MKIGFIGCGNMGGAIFRGFINNKGAKAEDIYLFDTATSLVEGYEKEFGINKVDSCVELVSKVDTLFLAVKPNIYNIVVPQIADEVKKHKPLLVSIAAGTSVEKVTELLGFEAPVIRIMPNINAEISMSTTAYCANSLVDENKLEEVVKLLSTIGTVSMVEEKLFPVFTAIASCSPAYVYLFIDSLAKGAQKMGMNKKQALEIAASAVLGSTQMLINEKGVHPWELIDRVCSPGGTTIEGVTTLEEYKFESAIVKAVENSVIKDSKMQK